MNEQFFTSLNGYKVKDEYAIHTYDSVSDMKADTKLKSGMYVKTKGYNNFNDGANGDYLIREKTNDDTEDNVLLIFLNNGLVAEKIKDEIRYLSDYISYCEVVTSNNVEYTDWLQAFNKALEDFTGTLYLTNGTFYVSDTIELNTGYVTIEGSSSTITLIPNSDVTGDSIIKTSAPYIYLKDITIEGSQNEDDTELSGGLLVDNLSDHCIFENVIINHIKGNLLQVNFHAYDSHFLNVLGNFATLNGAVINATDLFFNKCIFAYTQNNGFVINRGNNLFNLCKTYFTGLANRYLESEEYIDTGYGYFVNSTGASGAHTNRFINCEAQECGWHGFYIKDAHFTQLIGCLADTNGCYLQNSAGFVIDNSIYTTLKGQVVNKEFNGGIGEKNGKHDIGIIVSGSFNEIDAQVQLIDYSPRGGRTPTKFFTKLCDCNYDSTNSIIINNFDYYLNKFNEEMIEDDNNDGTCNGFTYGSYGTNIVGEAVIDYNERCQKLNFTNTSNASDGNNIKITKTINVQDGYTKFSMNIMRKEIIENFVDSELSVRFRAYDSSNNKLSESLKNTAEFTFSHNEEHRRYWSPFAYTWNIPNNTDYITIEILNVLKVPGALSQACIKDLSYIFS